MSKENNLIIIDADSMVHKSFHGYEPRLNIKGEDNRVLYGLMSYINEIHHLLSGLWEVVVAFDSDTSDAYRRGLFPEYKNNRPPSDPDLKRQKKEAKFILGNHLGFPIIDYPNYEADDSIGSIVKLRKKHGKVVIVTNDKDIMQLLDDDVALLKREKNKNTGFNEFVPVYNKDVEVIFGVKPSQIVDYLALVGDVADNLPGVPGVGQKTAIKLLREYGSVEGILKNTDTIKSERIKQSFLKNTEQLILVQKLAEIVTDLEIEEYLEWSLAKAMRIRMQKEYSSKLIKVKSYYRWPDYFLDAFNNT